jgi:hypothetical protein
MNESIRRHPGLVIATAVLILVSFTQTLPLYALPERSEITSYYSGCGTSKTFLGETGVDCYGHHPNSYNGVTPWKWRVHIEQVCDWNNCSEFCSTSSWWELKCQNGTSIFVTESEFLAGTCSC